MISIFELTRHSALLHKQEYSFRYLFFSPLFLWRQSVVFEIVEVTMVEMAAVVEAVIAIGSLTWAIPVESANS